MGVASSYFSNLFLILKSVDIAFNIKPK